MHLGEALGEHHDAADVRRPALVEFDLGDLRQPTLRRAGVHRDDDVETTVTCDHFVDERGRHAGFGQIVLGDVDRRKRRGAPRTPGHLGVVG